MKRTIRFGGRHSPKLVPSDSNDALDAVLGTLSWKYVTHTPSFDHTPISNQTPDELKGNIAHWAGRVWFHDHEMPFGHAVRRFEIMSLEPLFREYVRTHGETVFDEGMTLEEIWASQQLYSAAPMVAIVAEQFSDLITKRMGELVRREPSQALVWTLGAMSLWHPEFVDSGLNVLVWDRRVGHTIQIRGMNGIDYKHPRGVNVLAGWFSFHDPWPARSLLAPEHNFAGVQVLEDVSRPPFWLISPADLDRVIVGYLMPVDVLAPLYRVFRALEAVKESHGQSSKPLWVDTGGDDRPFQSLLAVQGAAPTTGEGLMSLGRVYLLINDVAGAIVCFKGAINLGVPLAKQRAADVLAKAGHDDLARKWR